MVVGFVMMIQVRTIDWNDGETSFAAFLTIVVMPFTCSITAGIGAGFVAYTLTKTARRRTQDVHPLMWLAAGLFVLHFAIGPVDQVPGVTWRP